MKAKIVYVAGPYRAPTPWEVEQHVRKAEQASLMLWSAGITNICPHTMNRYFDKAVDDVTALNGTQEILRRCDAVYVVGEWGFSKGTLAEVSLAKSLGMPIFSAESLDNLIHWSNNT